MLNYVYLHTKIKIMYKLLKSIFGYLGICFFNIQIVNALPVIGDTTIEAGTGSVNYTFPVSSGNNDVVLPLHFKFQTPNIPYTFINKNGDTLTNLVPFNPTPINVVIHLMLD